MNPIEKRLERIEVDETVDIPNAAGPGIAESIKVKVPAWRDPKDGEIYLDADAIALLDKAKARYFGVLSPQELASLRRRLALTQKDIGDALRIGEKTWSRWETGRERPSHSLNLILFALYEGKIDLAYLRSKLAAKTGSAPQPILKSFAPDLLTSGYSNWTMIERNFGPAVSSEYQAEWIFNPVSLLAAIEHRSIRISSLPKPPLVTAGNYERLPMVA